MQEIWRFLSRLLDALYPSEGKNADEPAPDVKVPTVDIELGWDGPGPYRYVDVSRWQGTIDWAKVKAAGYQGAMLRALGNSKGDKPSKPYVDPTFAANYNGARAAGLDVGAYYYTKAITFAEADVELSMLRDALDGKAFTMPIAVDVEDDLLKSLGKQQLTDMVAYELEKIEQMGFYAQLYSYTSFAQNRLYMGGAALKPYDVWLADYTGKTPKVDFAYNAHQHTSNGSVSGIAGEVDLNVTTVNYPKIICKKGLTRLRGGA